MKLTLLKLFAFTLLSVSVLIPGLAQSQMLDSLDRVMIDSALALLKLTPEELGFEKTWAEDDTFRLDIVERLLEEPLYFPDYVDETTGIIDSFSGNTGELLSYIGKQLEVDIKVEKRKFTKHDPIAVDPLHPLVSWQKAIEAAEPLRLKYYAELDSLELHDLIYSAPSLWSDDDDSTSSELRGSWQKEFGSPVDTSREINTDRLLDIIRELDVYSLIDAGAILLPTAEELASKISEIDPDDFSKNFAGSEKEEVPGITGDILYIETGAWGTFVIGGYGDNTYEGDFAAIIDPGGDDVYRGRCGGALGVLHNPYSLVIDLAGDDYYDSDGMALAQGAGFFGIGILIDKAGDDSYRGGNYCQGAGFFGIGYLDDSAGDDDYRGGFFLHGAGHCGVGLLVEKGTGDDLYYSTAWAQGFAGTYGYGLLYDAGGDESYRTGGAYFHAPLLPHDYRSFSGGFGMGWRPRAGGGIGVLYDNGDGNDFYNAEVMSLGSSYWYSIGILVDGGGNDHYTLAQYGLGVGIHLSAGALFDRSGDDQYRSRNGVVGATPHDFSIGLMVDGSGDDFYIVSDGWGGSLTNSFGLFIDRLGNDTYATRGGGYSLGNPRWARGFAGVAIFLDIEGDDVYPAGSPAADSSLWIRGGWGLGMDLPRDIIASAQEEEVGEIVLTAEDSAKSVEDLFAEASQWEVGSARKSVARARKALLERGAEAAHYAIENKLNTRDGLVVRLLEQIVNAMPDTAGPLLVEKLENSQDRYVLANAASLAGNIKWKPAVDPLMKLLKDKDREKVWNTAISALGQIGDKDASGRIVKFIDSESQKRRIIALQALQTLQDSSNIPMIASRLDDKMFTVRSAAIGALMGFGAKSVAALESYIANPESKYREIAIRGLGRIAYNLADSSDAVSGKIRFNAVRIFQDELNNDDDQIRAAAVDALYRNTGEATRNLIRSRMDAEYSPVVLAAYKRVTGEIKDDN